MAQGDFDHSLFINCPFDKDFEPLLQATDIREFPTSELLAIMQEWMARGQPLP
nr:hypothetical protein [uncultured Gellertiella sp.]